jgi:hypothetical protein
MTLCLSLDAEEEKKYNLLIKLDIGCKMNNNVTRRMIPSGTNNPPASRIVHKLVMNIAEILLP